MEVSWVALVALLWALSPLAACGQKGELYRPEPAGSPRGADQQGASFQTPAGQR